MKLASFDIFDTTLIRKCGQPECIFWLLGLKLYPEKAAKRDDFILWRRHIGEKLQKLTGKKNASLAELYENADFAPFTNTELVHAELEIESENLVANPLVQQEIAQYRNNGWAICFISDMYLPSSFLKDVLIREHCAEPSDEIFVSCEIKARKDIGTLYEVIHKKLHPERWEHWGDNVRSDIKMARKHGISSHHVTNRYTEIEKKTAEYAHLFRHNFDLKLFTGLSRAIRLQENDTPEAILAADYVAPAYLPYIFFVVKLARQKAIERLYFISRDGYILKQATEVAFPEFEMQEMFVSRNSLMLPYLAYDFTREAYLKIVDRNTLVSRNVNHMLWQLGLNKQILADQYDIKFEYNRINSKEDETDFLSKLFESSLTTYLQDEAIRQYDLLIRYFHQIKLTDNEPSLLVDIGWIGTSRLMINSILEHAGYAAKEYIYLGVRSDALPSKYGEYTTYFTDGELSSNSTTMIEHYYSQSPNPSVRRYQDVAGIVVPEWETPPHSNESVSLTINRKALRNMSQTLRNWNPSPETLYAWAKVSLNAIADLEENIDLSPLLKVGDFDINNFVKRFSCKEIIMFIFGKRISAFDEGSAIYTLGKFIGHKAIRIHKIAIRILYPIYSAWTKRK